MLRPGPALYPPDHKAVEPPSSKFKASPIPKACKTLACLTHGSIVNNANTYHIAFNSDKVPGSFLVETEKDFESKVFQLRML